MEKLYLDKNGEPWFVSDDVDEDLFVPYRAQSATTEKSLSPPLTLELNEFMGAD
jgi:hypothetical protein